LGLDLLWIFSGLSLCELPEARAAEDYSNLHGEGKQEDARLFP
jgi:hypothetical protein